MMTSWQRSDVIGCHLTGRSVRPRGGRSTAPVELQSGHGATTRRSVNPSSAVFATATACFVTFFYSPCCYFLLRLLRFLLLLAPSLRLLPATLRSDTLWAAASIGGCRMRGAVAWLVVLLVAPAALTEGGESSTEPQARSGYFPQDLPVRPYPPPPPQQQQQQHPAGGPYPGGPGVPPAPAAAHQPRPPTAGRPGSLHPGSQQPAMAMMSVTDTQVACRGATMLVQFTMSAPFWGIIYPYGHFHKCLLHEGGGDKTISLTLGQGTCADQQPTSPHAPLSPVIEHRLMIQWDPEIVEEWDSSIIVRCDRPEDYNKTIRFDLGTLEMPSHIRSGTHAGPQMWMELQKGEGPSAPELRGSVFLGQVLTLVFTLSHEYFDFDTNVLSCWAFDGDTERPQIEWAAPTVAANQQLAHRRFSGELQTVQEGCSVRPKIFGHFNKVAQDGEGRHSLTQYAFFKAFRFPTSDRISIQCSVQVCYRKCPQLQPCSEPYHPRTAAETAAESARRRRSLEDAEDDAEAPPAERVNMIREFQVLLPEESPDDVAAAPVHTTGPRRFHSVDGNNGPFSDRDCNEMTTLFVVLIVLTVLLAVLLSVLLWISYRRQACKSNSMVTPTK